MIESLEIAIERIESIPELKDKVAYDHFSTAQALPFAVYLFTEETDGADSYKGVVWTDFKIELYSETRNIQLERKILSVFSDVKVTTDCDYIKDERMYMTTFSFRFPQKMTGFDI